jgi:uncharacterized protein (DUF58 family)
MHFQENSGNFSPVLMLRDPVGRGRTARVVLAPLGRDESVRAAYRLPTERRGLLTVGPMAIEVTDPFGLASAPSKSTSPPPLFKKTR